LNKIAKKVISAALALTASVTAFTTASAADLSGWAISEYISANESGLVSYSVVSNNLKADITREEFCELIVNLYKKLTNEELSNSVSSPFTDTDSLAVAQAYCYGIVSGTDDTTFTPDRLVTREEMAKMLVRTLTAGEADIEIPTDSDTSLIDGFWDKNEISSWAQDSVVTALKYSLLNGETDYTLNPLGSTTREQAIASVNRSYHKFAASNYTLSLPEIISPSDGSEIEKSDITVEWMPVSGAFEYRVIVKDQNGNSLSTTSVIDSTSLTIGKDQLPVNNDYIITVGAVMPDQSEVYSMPVDFRYYSIAANPVIEPIQSTVISDSSASPAAQRVLDTAAKYLGVPYVWGGTTPSGFDCSGFVQYVYAECGYSITRTTYTQWDNDGSYVSRANLQPGDLVYFGTDGSPSHVGLYVGNGTMIHAPSTGKTVQYTSIDSDYYTSRFMGGKRIL
jgi:cell wall-associated NlpC family hydrolase